MRSTIHLALFFLSLAIYPALSAQDEDSELEIIDLQQINITASPLALKQEDLVLPADILSGENLRRAGESSLGATLNALPGLHNTSYAPGAGRPIIRGFDGDRVRILKNGTDVFDASFTSPDHGVAIEPVLIERVEIIRGPASLLYGNAAIGGIVNVIDKSIPRNRVTEPTSEAELRYGTVAGEKTGGFSVQSGRSNFAWNLNYVKREAGDYEIPGFAESEYLREHEEEEDHHEEEEHHEGEEEEEGEEHHEEEEDHHEEETSGILLNSAVETENASIGFGWFTENASYGIAFNQYDSFYGVPGHTHAEGGHGHGHGEEEGHDEEEGHEGEEEEDEDHHDEEEGHHEDEEDHGGSVVIDLENTRVSFRAEWVAPNDLFESSELNIAYADSRYHELEGTPGDREIGTTLERSGVDLRFTGVHRPIGDLTGALGVHIKDEYFLAEGEEAYIPGNDLSNYALFAVERYNTDWGAAEFGGRIEGQSLSPDSPDLSGEDDTIFNLSGGWVVNLQENNTIAVNLAYNERAPNAAERYAFGPHVGTQSFEIGNPDLGIEQSNSLNASWRKSAGAVTGEVSLFFSEFKDFIFQEHLDHEVFEELYPEEDTGGLEILMVEAVDAQFYGFEVDLRFNLIDETEDNLYFDLTYDQTRATNQTEDSNLPRIPPRRIGGRLVYESGPWVIGLGARHTASAKHLAPEETPTEGYTVVNADITHRIESGNIAYDLFLYGRNLTDEEIRPHTSFTKDRVPMPGFGISTGLRVHF